MEHYHMYHHGWHFFPAIFFFMMMFFFIIMCRRRNYFRRWRNFGSNRNYDFFRPSGTFESASDILKKRYAGGEISKEEFEQIKKDLQNQHENDEKKQSDQ